MIRPDSEDRVLHALFEAQGGICRHVAALCAWTEGPARPGRVIAPTTALDRMTEMGLPTNVPRTSLRHSGLQGLFELSAGVRAFRKQVSLVHAHGYRAALAVDFSRVRPRIVTAHNLPPARAHALVRFVLRRLEAVVAVSSAVADALLDIGVPGRLLRVIPNGIALIAPPTEADRTRARALLLELSGADQTKPISNLILAIGRFSAEKGFGTLVEAFAALLRTHPESALVMVGDGPEHAALRSLAGGLTERIFFTGFLPQVRALICGADIVVIPSLVEGQSIVALEALAAGVRVVASDVGGLPSMIRPGETGWLVQPGEATDLRDAMRSALSTAPDVFRAAGRQLVASEFSQRASMDRLLSLYEEVLTSAGFSQNDRIN